MYGKSQLPNIHNEKGTEQSFYSLKGNIDNFIKRILNRVVDYKETDSY